MAKFKIPVPDDVYTMAMQGVKWMNGQVADGTLPKYPVFVNNLMKDMPTTADEMHHACTGIAGEAGELLDLSKKVWANNKPLDLAHLIEELGDLRFYYQALLNMVQLSDEEVQAQNMIKLNKRYASGAYSDAQAQARADKVPGDGRKFFGKPEANPAEVLRGIAEQHAALGGPPVDHASFDAAAKELEKPV